MLLLVLNLPIKAQVLDTVMYSEPDDFSKKQFGVSQLETDDELINVFISEYESAISFVSYDKNSLQKLREFSWSMTGEGYYDYTIEAVAYFQDKIVILSSYADVKANEHITELTAINSVGDELMHKELSRLEWRRRETKDFFLFKSPNSEFIGVSSIYPYIKRGKSELDLYILNTELGVESGANLELPNIEQIGAPPKFEMTDRGEVFFLSGIDKKKTDISNAIGLEKRVYQLYKYDYRSDKLKQYDVTISDKYINDVKMKTHINGDLYVFGLYNYSFEKGVEGVFLMVIDQTTGKIKRSGKKALDVKILSEFISDKRLRKSPSIDDAFLDHFYIKENGHIVFLAEVFKVDQRMITNTNGTSITTSKYYNFGEILGVELDGNLDYVQHDVIWKRQRSTNYYSNYWSYCVVLSEDIEYPILIYNYYSSRNEKNAHVVSQVAKSDTYARPLFGNEATIIKLNEKIRVAPFFNSEFTNSYFILQDRHSYAIGELKFKR